MAQVDGHVPAIPVRHFFIFSAEDLTFVCKPVQWAKLDELLLDFPHGKTHQAYQQDQQQQACFAIVGASKSF